MPTTVNVPREKTLDNTLAFFREGYLFIKNRMDQYQTDLFITRLLGEEVICITGEEAAKMFYDPEKFRRKGTVPYRIQQSLFGVNAIQTMDGDAHLQRKQLLLSILKPPQQHTLAQMVLDRWMEAAEEWQKQSRRIVLLDEAKTVLCEVACRWAGVPIKRSELARRGNDFAAMVDAFGAIGPRHWKGRLARNSVEAWFRDIISDTRVGKRKAQEGTALHAIAFYKEDGKRMLDVQMAAIELINIVRPIVAIANFIVFSALALHQYPHEAEKLRSGGDEHRERFAQEVRRYYPFTPFLGNRVKQDFTWRGCHFKKDTLVLLDIYGMNHDSRLWEEPEQFRPDRFLKWDGGSFTFIPQGGGDPAKGHRCPGEHITVEIMKATIEFLLHRIAYQVPAQNLQYSLSRIPTFPESGFQIENVRLLT